MNEFEISIKSAPVGAFGTVEGSNPTIIVQFGILANMISENHGIPLWVLATAVMKGPELLSQVASGSVCVDEGAIDRARGGEK